ncbi:MAG: Zinc metalloprotease [Verrucomicrobiaceae bacterium]|nr:Zinc metalloprotease [Verrucomicrobiaceae bacterium]
MKWSLRIATIAGTEVRIHATFLLLLLFVASQAISEGLGAAGAREMVLLVCALFVCVLLHEFGHVTAARRYGIKTPDITLWPIGGVARLERMPRKPSEEFVVAICGPLVNVVIAGVLALVLAIPLSSNAGNMGRPGHFFETLMELNIFMVLFNLIPAFPMDGGRILRALLNLATGDYAKATRWAAMIGQGIALLVVMSMLLSHWFHPTLLLMAFFVFYAAGQEASIVTEQEQVHDLRVSDAMMTSFQVLQPHAVLREAVEMMLAGSQHDFPVLSESGGIIGILTRQRLIGALSDHGPGHPVEDLIEPCEGYVEPRIALDVAMDHLRGGPCSALPVMDPVSGKLVGLLTAENIGEALLVRAAMKRQVAAA